jgi:hypothetical protein
MASISLKSNTTTIIMAIVAVIIIVIGLVFFASNKFGNNNKTISSVTKAINTIKVTPQNFAFFNINYPENWTKYDEINGTDYWNTRLAKGKTILVISLQKVNDYPAYNNIGYAEWYKQYGENENEEVDEFSILGRKMAMLRVDGTIEPRLRQYVYYKSDNGAVIPALRLEVSGQKYELRAYKYTEGSTSNVGYTQNPTRSEIFNILSSITWTEN